MKFTTHDVEAILIHLAERARAIEHVFTTLADSEDDDAYMGHAHTAADLREMILDLYAKLPESVSRLQPFAEETEPEPVGGAR